MKARYNNKVRHIKRMRALVKFCKQRLAWADKALGTNPLNSSARAWYRACNTVLISLRNQTYISPYSATIMKV